MRTEATGESLWSGSAVALLVLLCSSLLAPLLLAQQSSELSGEGNVLRQFVYFLVFVLALWGGRAKPVISRLASVPAAIWLVLCWCLLSLVWAVDPATGARRFALTAIIVMSIFLLVEDIGYEVISKILRIVLIWALVLNFAAILLFPLATIHQFGELDPSIIGAWHGILGQKNFAGLVCALTIIIFLFDSQSLNRMVRLSVVLAAAFFLYKTESKTSALTLCASLGAGVAALAYNTYYRNVFLTAAALLAVVLSIFAYQYWDVLMAPFSAEDALTGRVQIWPVLLSYWQDHWLLGSGYGSFWNIRGVQPVSLYTGNWITQMASGHNGFLDQLVQLGLPGLLLVVFAMILLPMRRLIVTDQISTQKRALIVAIIVFCILHNFTESSILDRDAIVNVFLILAIALLHSKAGQPVVHSKAG